jgi:hypothetical protein
LRFQALTHGTGTHRVVPDLRADEPQDRPAITLLVRVAGAGSTPSVEIALGFSGVKVLKVGGRLAEGQALVEQFQDHRALGADAPMDAFNFAAHKGGVAQR